MTIVGFWLSCLGLLVVLLPNNWLSNLSSFSLPDEVYSRDASCALNVISTFISQLYWWRSSYQNVNSIGGVMVSMLASSEVHCGFESRSGQTKEYKIGIS